MPHRRSRLLYAGLLVAVGAALIWGSAIRTPARSGAVLLTIEPGESVSSVLRELYHRQILPHPAVVRIGAAVSGRSLAVHPGHYEIRPDDRGAELLRRLADADLVRRTVTVPEGAELPSVAGRVAAALDRDSAALLARMTDSAAASRYGVPGPTLEGYLYPATYRLPEHWSDDAVLRRMVDRHDVVRTVRRIARADSLGLTWNQVVTLASILEAEARFSDEMPTMSAVYHNRLERGMRLQADPTVQYILPGHRRRLLYATIDSVAASPYNTYTNRGLPPGPIGAASEAAIEAALYPAESDALFFVAGPDGRHTFTKTLAAHNRAKRASRRRTDR